MADSNCKFKDLLEIKEFLEKSRSFIENYAFHTDLCSYHNTEFCNCSYKERIEELRKLYNILKKYEY
jgi:hypothetical protein